MNFKVYLENRKHVSMESGIDTFIHDADNVIYHFNVSISMGVTVLLITKENDVVVICAVVYHINDSVVFHHEPKDHFIADYFVTIHDFNYDSFIGDLLDYDVGVG